MKKYKYEVEVLQRSAVVKICVQFTNGAGFLKQDEVRLYRFSSTQGTDSEVCLFKNIISE